jgi:tetratricopeptide (TPR) repeat protein
MHSQSTRYEALAGRAAVLERHGAWDEAATLYAEVYNQAITSGALEEAATALVQGGRAMSRKGRLQEANNLARLSMDLAERNGLLGVSAHAVSLLGAIHFLQSDFSAAEKCYTQARDAARALGDDLLVWSTTQNLGIIANIHGDFREARALYLESIGSAIRGEDRAGAMTTYLNLGKACVCLEDWLEAAVYFERGIEIAEQLGEVPMQTRLHANLAIPLVHMGEFPRARTVLNTAEHLATRIGDTETLSHIARLRGRIARLQGDFAAAREYLADSLRLATGTGFELARAEALEEQGRLYQAEGHLEEACIAFEAARTCFLAISARHDVARMEELLSQCRATATTLQTTKASA